MYQHVYNPTRYRENSTPHILDLIFSNEKDFVEDIQHLPGLGLSDHVCYEFSFKCYSEYNPVSKSRYNLHCADFSKMRRLISDVDWESTLNHLDLQDAWDYFSSVFDDTVTKCIPLDLPRPKKIFICHTKLSASKIRNANSGIDTSLTGLYLPSILTAKLEMSYAT